MLSLSKERYRRVSDRDLLQFIVIVNNVERTEPLMTQMEQWSILSNVLNYVQHSRFISMNHALDVKAVNRYKSKPNTDREFNPFTATNIVR